MNWDVLLSRQAVKDAGRLARAGLKGKALGLLDVLERNPFAVPPPYEKLVGDLRGFYSRRINVQHRLIYKVDVAAHKVKVLRMWTHYE